MAKIIKLDENEVVIAQDDNSIVRYPYHVMDFEPGIGDLVEIFPEGDSVSIYKADRSIPNNQMNHSNQTKRFDEQIHINIVNDHIRQQPTQPMHQQNYAMNGKVVSKWAYFFLALCLGWLGIHKFYSGFILKGVLYLLLFWTTVPFFISMITCLFTLFKSTDRNGNIVVTS
ncbi:hypothetical protein IGI37_001020 [Enterococcus sp. AZ194]|uniref:TM2 domain-containing protein n=1 Tax=Enterococcus sp. AZ194 TaxID=2774629 RepID=UPI003F1E54BC